MRGIRKGFTLVELLVVIGIIGVLIGILLPALNRARQQAIKIKCLSQLRQLGNSFALYVNDNRGWMPSSDTCGPIAPQNFYDSSESQLWTSTSATQTWIGWVDAGPTDQALMNGTLWKYVKNTRLYKCPADLNDYRNRTYSLNNLICEGGFNTGGQVNLYKVYKITQVGLATKTITFAEEMDSRGTNGTGAAALQGQWNVNGWEQYPVAVNLPSNWIDTIASWHQGGANFSFVDGHAEHWKFTDNRTLNYLKNDPTWPNPLYVTPNNNDLARIQASVCTWAQQRAN